MFFKSFSFFRFKEFDGEKKTISFLTSDQSDFAFSFLCSDRVDFGFVSTLKSGDLCKVEIRENYYQPKRNGSGI